MNYSLLSQTIFVSHDLHCVQVTRFLSVSCNRPIINLTVFTVLTSAHFYGMQSHAISLGVLCSRLLDRRDFLDLQVGLLLSIVYSHNPI